jgi:alkylated DNA repair dioxygenase AlkB
VIQRTLFQTAEIPGFEYREGLLSVVEEQNFLRQFATLPFKPFEFHGYLGNRRIVSYGWQYDYGSQKLRDAQALPDFLAPLREVAGDFGGLAPENLVHTLVTEYAPGAGIGWHRDKPMFQDVVALSFAAPCRLRFRRRAGNGWERRAIGVLPRSGYILRGEARHLWEHSISPMTALRYSVTFRTFTPEFRKA